MANHGPAQIQYIQIIFIVYKYPSCPIKVLIALIIIVNHQFECQAKKSFTQFFFFKYLGD